MHCNCAQEFGFTIHQLETEEEAFNLVVSVVNCSTTQAVQAKTLIARCQQAAAQIRSRKQVYRTLRDRNGVPTRVAWRVARHGLTLDKLDRERLERIPGMKRKHVEAILGVGGEVSKAKNGVTQ